MKKLIIILLLACIAMPAYSFECFGSKEGDSKRAIQKAGTKFLSMVEDYGTFQDWEVQPTAKNSNRTFDHYIYRIDEELGLFQVYAFSDYVSGYTVDGHVGYFVDYEFNQVYKQLVKRYGEPARSNTEVDEYLFMWSTWENGSDRIHLMADSIDITGLAKKGERFDSLKDRIIWLDYSGELIDAAFTRKENQQTSVL